MGNKIILALVSVAVAGVFISPLKDKLVNLKGKILGIQDSKVRLEIFTPSVFVQLPNSSSFAVGENGQKIPVGTKVKTDDAGRAQLVYPNGSVTRIDYNTEVTLSEFSESPQKTRVKVSKGSIWSRVTKLLGGEYYKTESSTLVASVRGTSYGHTILPEEKNTVLVTQSKVAVQCFNSIEEYMVEEGNQITWDCKKNPQTGEITKEDKKNEWIIFNLQEDKKIDNSVNNDAELKPTTSPKGKSGDKQNSSGNSNQSADTGGQQDQVLGTTSTDNNTKNTKKEKSPSPTLTPSPFSSPTPTPSLNPSHSPHGGGNSGNGNSNSNSNPNPTGGRPAHP